ncbi:hypothetical protein [Thermosipho melanesiensis]|nr:hypothetical protein [Thermosipho melanesiensis]
MAKKWQKFKKYSSELKYQVIKLFIEENLPEKLLLFFLVFHQIEFVFGLI